MLNEKLKLARNSKELTQDDVAAFLNVKRQTYSAYERGVSIPDAIVLKKLADFFEVSVDYLLSTEDDLVIGTSIISEKERTLFERYQKAKESDDPRDNAVADAVEKLLGLDE